MGNLTHLSSSFFKTINTDINIENENEITLQLLQKENYIALN